MYSNILIIVPHWPFPCGGGGVKWGDRVKGQGDGGQGGGAIKKHRHSTLKFLSFCKSASISQSLQPPAN